MLKIFLDKIDKAMEERIISDIDAKTSSRTNVELIYTPLIPIIRTNIFGIDPNGRDFISNIIKNLKNKKSMIGFDDIIYSPLEISNLVEMIIEILKINYCGIIHLSSDIPISKYQFILEVADVFKLDKTLVKKGTSEEIKFIAKRPKNLTLCNDKAKKILKTQIIPLKESLKKIRIKS